MNTVYVTPDGEQLQTRRSVLFSLSGLQTPSFFDDIGALNGTGSTLTHVGSEYVLTAGPSTSNGSTGYSVTLETSKLTRFSAGMTTESNMTARFVTAPTSLQGARWGAFTNDPAGTDYGLSYAYGSTGLSIVIKSSQTGVTTTIAQTQWLDKLDGTGTSGLTINMTLPNQYVILTDTNGISTFQIRVMTSTGLVPVTVYQFFPATFPAFIDPCFPLVAGIYNNDTTPFTMNLSGRSAAILGRFHPSIANGSHGAINLTINAATLSKPLVSVRRLVGGNTAVGSSDQFNNVGIFLTGFQFICNQDSTIQVLQNCTLVGATFVPVDAPGQGESAMEGDTAATSITANTGVMRFKSYLRGSGNSGTVLFPQPIYIARDQSITLSARTISGVTATASCRFIWYEER